MAVERRLILAEPDAVARGLSGEIVARFERRGFVLGGAPLLRVDRALAEQHSAEHVEEPFLGKLVDFITSSPTLAFVLEGGRDRDQPGRRRLRLAAWLPCARDAEQPGARV